MPGYILILLEAPTTKNSKVGWLELRVVFTCTTIVGMWVLYCWPAAGSPRSYQSVWGIYMAIRTHIWNVHEVEVVVTDSISVFFVYISGIMCMMCCTWHVFVMALKVERVSSAQNRWRLPTISLYISYQCVWRMYMAIRTRIRNVREVEVVVTDSALFLSTYLVWCVWCVVPGMSLWWRSRRKKSHPHKTEEDSRPYIYVYYIYMNAPDREQRFEKNSS